MGRAGLLSAALRLARAHLMAIDVLVATALTAGGVAEAWSLHSAHRAITVAAAVAVTSAVGWRRAAPASAAAIALVAIAVYQVNGHDSEGSFFVPAVLATCYLAGRQPIARSIGVALIGLIAIGWIQVESDDSALFVLGKWLPLIVVPLLVGAFVSWQARLVERLEELEAQLETDTRLARRGARDAERVRIARELHDVVAHCVSVTVIQAGAARMVASSDQPAARDALVAVSDSASVALAELRRMTDDTASVASHAPIGLELPPELEHATSRIIEEALTNARKHAPGARTRVDLRSDRDVITLVVENAAPPTVIDRVPIAPGSGQGLVGIRERVALLGGRAEVGPTAAGGFVVKAVFPLARQAADEPTRSAAHHLPRHKASAGTIDTAIALGWLIAMETEVLTSTHRVGPVMWNAVVVAGMAAIGLRRRQAPLVYAAVVCAGALALTSGLTSFRYATVTGMCVVLTVPYGFASYLRARSANAALGVMLAGMAATASVTRQPAGAAIGACLVAIVAWLIGAVVARQRSLRSQLTETNRRLVRERDARAAAGRYQEQLRIASSLDAQVAALVAAIRTEADLAQALILMDVPAALTHIAKVEQHGRAALEQVRDLLGVLRNAVESPLMAPSADAARATDELEPVR